MADHSASLFTIDLKIDSQLLKLKVKAEDCLSDLIANLAASITWKTLPADKIKDRLEQQFRKLITQNKVSAKVKNKLEDLLQQSKFVIVGIDNQSHQIFDETPFRILQESHINGRKSHQTIQKPYQYLNTHNVNLHNNYEFKQPKQNLSSRKTQNQFQKIVVKPKSPQKYHYCFEEKRQDTLEGQAIRKKYQEIDRKCQDYIYRNLANSEEMKEYYDRYRQNKVQRDSQDCNQPLEKLFERSKSTNLRRIAKATQNNDRILININKPYEQSMLISTQKVLNSDVINKFKANKQSHGGESFHEYKMNRYKSTHSMHGNHFSNVVLKPTSGKQSRNNLQYLSNRQAIQQNDKYAKNSIFADRTENICLKREYANSHSTSHIRKQGNHKKYQYDLEN